MRQIFANKDIETLFRKKGYVLIPFAEENTINELKNQLQLFKPADNFNGNQDTAIGQQSFHITFFDSDYNYKKGVFDFARNYFNESASKLLINYKCAQANVFLKPAHSGFVVPHQNLTIVDENKFNSLSFWLPLQNTNFDNGTICLIPGSQNISVKYRNTHVYWPYAKYCMTHEGKKHFIPIEVKKGELLILDDRIMHYTPLNKTSEGRWVLHSLWAPQEAQIKYFDPSQSQINVYAVADDFWQFHLPGTKINSKKPDEVFTNDEIIYPENEFVSLLEKLNAF